MNKNITFIAIIIKAPLLPVDSPTNGDNNEEKDNPIKI